MKDDSTRTLRLIPFAFDLSQGQLQDGVPHAEFSEAVAEILISESEPCYFQPSVQLSLPRHVARCLSRLASQGPARGPGQTQRKKSTLAERADRQRL